MQQDFQQAFAYIAALTGDGNSTVDFRLIHDRDKGIQAMPMRGTLQQHWQTLSHWNSQGWGAFVNIQEMDGNGRHLTNVRSIRTAIVDLDDPVFARQSWQAATSWHIQPQFSVNSSPNKFHVYWRYFPWLDITRYDNIERKLVAKFGGDPQVIDAARVMRLPGTFHNKAEPYLVTFQALNAFGYAVTVDQMEQALSDVQVRHGHGSRHELGEGQQAPNLNVALKALNARDPNELDRAEWIKVMASFKQSTATLIDEQTAYNYFMQWCERYEHNDIAENNKQWNSIRNTEVGFNTLVGDNHKLKSEMLLGPSTTKNPEILEKLNRPQPRDEPKPMPAPVQPMQPLPTTTFNEPPPMPDPLTPSEQLGEMVDGGDCEILFKGCYFIERFGSILTPSKRMMDPKQFNGRYGGKIFIIDRLGKTSKSPWEAATTSTLYTIPKMDHTRFLPHEKPGSITYDAIGRPGVNTYTPANVKRRAGDVTPFLNHLELLLPLEEDRNILIAYLAHNARFPGYKIPWAPLIQSEEGAGKKAIKRIISHIMGSNYVYYPKAQELAESGAKFNAWQREKLFILVDEVRVDERRDLIEVLKPMISEEEIEVQGKGKDQDKEDNYSNWMFFTNYRDAIPIRKNGRRFSIFYSQIQSVDDLIRLNMDQTYFDTFYGWLDFGSGLEIIADYLLNYPVERGALPKRAPITSSTQEALERSRGPLERLLSELILDARPGFRNGWISSVAFKSAIKEAGLSVRSDITIEKVIEGAGFSKAGRAVRDYFQESPRERTTLFHMSRAVDLQQFGRDQGYE